MSRLLILAFVLIPLNAFAFEKVVSGTILCDKREQIQEILQTAKDANDFYAGLAVFNRYRTTRNELGEPACGPIRQGVFFFTGNLVKFDDAINPDGSKATLYIIEVRYYQNTVTGHILASKEALDRIFTLPEKPGEEA